MSVKHSPTRNPTTPEQTARIMNSSSQPNLTNIGVGDTTSKNICLRKRKTPENDLTYQFEELKSDLMEIIAASFKSQTEKLEKIDNNITTVKDQLNDLKTTTKYLIAENSKIKTHMTELTNNISATEEKVKLLQDVVLQIKANSVESGQTASPNNLDELITELHEREERSKNIIITGIKEQTADTADERRRNDEYEVIKITTSIYPECPKPIKVLRIGKYNIGKTRALKITYTSQDIAKAILRTKSNLTEESVKIYSDQTPYQQKYMKHLKEELKNRTDSGETGLTIKYMKGVPKIIKLEPKN